MKLTVLEGFFKWLKISMNSDYWHSSQLFILIIAFSLELLVKSNLQDHGIAYCDDDVSDFHENYVVSWSHLGQI